MKTEEYLKSNPIVAKFIQELTEYQQSYHRTHFEELYKSSPDRWNPVVEVGNKYIKITINGSCWGFISRVDGDIKGAPIRKGDLLKAANWRTPAKHARGNIIDGTASYDVYSPSYLR